MSRSIVLCDAIRLFEFDLNSPNICIPSKNVSAVMDLATGITRLRNYRGVPHMKSEFGRYRCAYL